MPVTISRWGNSLGVRLPKDALARARLREGDALLVEVTEEGLLLRAAARSNLEALLAAITPENLHGETETGNPVGQEPW
ncbi:MAG: AbrB/MazE/SpoVT family DNA-binding domain-containing protein [Candidatus Tyrphobacter sp.]